MTAPAKDREQSHPAARAAHTVLDAINLVQAAPWLHGSDPLGQALGAFEQIAELLADVAQDVAWLHSDREAKAAELLEQRAEMCDFARTIAELEAAAIAMEQLDTKRVGVISELKTRLARAAEENEELYRLTNHEVGDATERHLTVTRVRDLLDLDTPIPPRAPARCCTSPATGAPRIAATH